MSVIVARERSSAKPPIAVRNSPQNSNFPRDRNWKEDTHVRNGSNEEIHHAATCLWRRSKNLCMVAWSFRSCCCSRSHVVCTDSRNRHDFHSVINEHHQSSQRVRNAGDLYRTGHE